MGWTERRRSPGDPLSPKSISLLAWSHAGGPLVDGEGRPTKRLHVFGARWDLAAEGYEPVW
jgi:hypothetical protein